MPVLVVRLKQRRDTVTSLLLLLARVTDLSACSMWVHCYSFDNAFEMPLQPTVDMAL